MTKQSTLKPIIPEYKPTPQVPHAALQRQYERVYAEATGTK